MKAQWLKIALWRILILSPVLALVLWVLRSRWRLNDVMTIGNLVVIIVALLGQHWFAARAPERRRPIIRRLEGIWLDPPIAEVDKSTLGKLLASRMRREPGLHVVVRGTTTEPHPISSDSLYDPELDG